MLELKFLKAGGPAALQIDEVELTLAERAGPVLRARLTTGQNLNDPHLRMWLDAVEAETEVEFVFGNGVKLTALLLGYEADGTCAGGVTPAVVAVALVLPESVRGWFDLPTPGSEKLLWLIAQRSRDQHPWDFLGQTLNKRLAALPGNVDWSSLFGPESCILRVGAWTNRCFFEYLVTLLTERTTAVLGWSVVSDEAQPLRLITDLAPIVLDDQWRIEYPPRRASDLAGVDWARRPVKVRTALACADGGVFFRLLASTGVQSMTDQFVAVVPLRTAQIVLLPGVAQFGGQRLFIAAAHYRWKEGEQVQVVLDLRRPSKPQARVAGCHPVLDAQVKDWATKTDGETSLGLLPANHGGKQERAVWGVIGENGSVDPARPLFAKVMTPFAGRPGEPSNGLYVTHKEKDPVTVLVAHGQTPTILGQAQRAHAAFEKVGVALNAQSILLSVSPPGTATADADAVHLAKGVITAGASQKVELMRNVVIEPERSTVAGEMHAQKKVQIDGEVVTGKDVSVGGNLKVEKNLEAGGA